MDGLGSHGALGPLGSSHGVPKKERSPSPSDCMSPDTMNPPSPADSSEYFKHLSTPNVFQTNLIAIQM